jgi:hypothetical protein
VLALTRSSIVLYIHSSLNFTVLYRRLGRRSSSVAISCWSGQTQVRTSVSTFFAAPHSPSTSYLSGRTGPSVELALFDVYPLGKAPTIVPAHLPS